MRKIIITTLATLVATGSIFASYGSANAGEHRHHDKGAAIVGGLAAGIIGGLVAGALIKDRDRPQFDDGADYRYSGGLRYENGVGYRGYRDPDYRYSTRPRYEDNSEYGDFDGPSYRYNDDWR